MPAKPAAAGATRPTLPTRPTPGAAKPPEGAGHQAKGRSSAEQAELEAPVTRREFLNYAWLGTLGVFALQLGIVTYFFSLPRFKAGEFGGAFDLGAASDVIPKSADAPAPNQKGKFWLSNTDQGIIALYNVCVHLGCLYQWQTVTNRFECPCHGSKYQKNGTYIEGPAPRSLDRMVIRFLDDSGKEVARTNAKGDPMPLPGPGARMVVETGMIITGQTHG